MTLTPVQLKILKALARYRFLTNSQLVGLNIGSRDYVGRMTYFLAHHPTRAPFLKVHRFPVHARLGRLENLYTLSMHGSRLLAGMISLPSQPSYDGAFYQADYFHRKAVVQFDIWLDQYLGDSPWRLTSRTHYFDFEGANHHKSPSKPLTAQTKIHFQDETFFIPDTLFLLENHSAKRWVFSLEYVRGKKAKRTLNQIAKHMKAIAEGAVCKRFGVPSTQDYVSLFLFEDADFRDRILSEWEDHRYRSFHEHFLFASFEDTKRDLVQCWRKGGNNLFLFNFITGKPAFKLPT